MEEYYLKQAQSGIGTGAASGAGEYEGTSRHLGRGFFSSAVGLFQRALPFLGRSLLNSAVNISEELASKGEDAMSVKDALKKSSVAAISDGLDTLKMAARKKIMGGRRRKRGRPKGGGKRRVSGGRRKSSVKGRRRRHSKYSPHLFP